jgi:hypothetical protein
MQTGMKWVFIGNMIMTVAVACSGCARTSANPVVPKACPYGHAALKDVPVEYGFIGNVTPEVQRRLDNLEFVPGGCCFEPGVSRESLLICTQCKYSYDPTTAEWWRCDHDPNTFQRPLSHAVRQFALTATGDPDDVSYDQAVRHGRVASDGVSYRTTESHAQVAVRVVAFLEGLGVTPQAPKTEEMLGMTEWTTYRFRVNGGWGGVNLMRIVTNDPPTIDVSFDWPAAR